MYHPASWARHRRQGRRRPVLSCQPPCHGPCRPLLPAKCPPICHPAAAAEFPVFYHSLSTPSFCTTPFGGVPGGPGAARRLPRASRRCWGVGQSGATLVGPAVGDSGPVESASRCLRCWRVCARCRRNNSNLQVIVRSGSKLTLVFDLLMLLVAYKRRAGVIRACQCSSASQDGSSNPEATSDLQSGKDCLTVFYYMTKVQTCARSRSPSALSRFPHACFAQLIARHNAPTAATCTARLRLRATCT